MHRLRLPLLALPLFAASQTHATSFYGPTGQVWHVGSDGSRVEGHPPERCQRALALLNPVEEIPVYKNWRERRGDSEFKSPKAVIIKAPADKVNLYHEGIEAMNAIAHELFSITRFSSTGSQTHDRLKMYDLIREVLPRYPSTITHQDNVTDIKDLSLRYSYTRALRLHKRLSSEFGLTMIATDPQKMKAALLRSGFNPRVVFPLANETAIKLELINSPALDGISYKVYPDGGVEFAFDQWDDALLHSGYQYLEPPSHEPKYAEPVYTGKNLVYFYSVHHVELWRTLIFIEDNRSTVKEIHFEQPFYP